MNITIGFHNITNKEESVVPDNIGEVHNVSNSEEDIAMKDEINGFHNVSDSDKSAMRNKSGCLYEARTMEQRVEAAVQLAYDVFMEYIEAIKDDFRLGEINTSKTKIIENVGTYFKINFEIGFIPARDTMDCVTIVLENFDKSYEVFSVICDCCLEQDTSALSNVIEYNDSQ